MIWCSVLMLFSIFFCFGVFVSGFDVIIWSRESANYPGDTFVKILCRILCTLRLEKVEKNSKLDFQDWSKSLNTDDENRNIIKNEDYSDYFRVFKSTDFLSETANDRLHYALSLSIMMEHFCLNLCDDYCSLF